MKPAPSQGISARHGRNGWKSHPNGRNRTRFGRNPATSAKIARNRPTQTWPKSLSNDASPIVGRHCPNCPSSGQIWADELTNSPVKICATGSRLPFSPFDRSVVGRRRPEARTYNPDPVEVSRPCELRNSLQLLVTPWSRPPSEPEFERTSRRHCVPGCADWDRDVVHRALRAKSRPRSSPALAPALRRRGMAPRPPAGSRPRWSRPGRPCARAHVAVTSSSLRSYTCRVADRAGRPKRRKLEM